WQNSQGEYLVVDYKATAKAEEITELNQGWHISYKRQMEVYQWLLRQNGYKVSSTGYFVYCNGIADAAAFDQKLEFRVNLIAYTGEDSWVEKTIIEAHQCLNGKKIPPASPDCDYCNYIVAINSKSLL
ncbi:MAG: PD-(D/E)XK nuclease family protein, partial [Candidatus Gribaldobacteria bacterium]|nr:PD-(D/E)XK nuclease family protein [Candidatus Gribaldobacteria bacterium]